MQNKERESKYELLRIVAIFIIVLYHFCLHTVGDDVSGVSVNRIIEALYHTGGKIGVNLFVLLTGFFQGKKDFKSKKLVDLEAHMYFYCAISLIIYICMVRFGQVSFSLKLVLRLLFPTTYSAYWFMTAYIGLYFLSPFLNEMLMALSFKRKIALISILGIMVCIWPTFLLSKNWVNDLVLFIYIYIVGATIGQHIDEVRRYISRKMVLCVGAVSLLLAWGGGAAVLIIAEKYIPQISGHTNYLTGDYSPLMLSIAVSMLVFVIESDIKNNKWINELGKLTLGVYLIQSNSIIADYLLWPSLAKFDLFNFWYWPIIAVFIAIVVVLACFCIEYCRGAICKTIHITFVDKICDRIDKFIN